MKAFALSDLQYKDNNETDTRNKNPREIEMMIDIVNHTGGELKFGALVGRTNADRSEKVSLLCFLQVSENLTVLRNESCFGADGGCRSATPCTRT